MNGNLKIFLLFFLNINFLLTNSNSQEKDSLYISPSIRCNGINSINNYKKINSIKDMDIFYYKCVDSSFVIKDTLFASKDTLIHNDASFKNLDSTIIYLTLNLDKTGNFYNDKDYMSDFYELLLSGTSKRNNERLSKDIDSAFIDYSVYYDKITILFYKKNKEFALELLSDIVNNSIFSPRRVNFKKVIPSNIDFDFFYNTCILEGNYDLEKKYNKTLLESIIFYKNYWKKNNINISIYGGISKKEIEDLLKNGKYNIGNNMKIITYKKKKKKKKESKLKQQQGTLIYFLDKDSTQNKELFIASYSDEKPTTEEKEVARIYSKIFKEIFDFNLFLDFNNNNKGIVFYGNNYNGVEKTIKKIKTLFEKLTKEGFYNKLNAKILKDNILHYKEKNIIFSKKYQIDFFEKFIFNKNLRILIKEDAIKITPQLENKNYNILFINDKGKEIPRPKLVLNIEKNITVTTIIDRYFKNLGGLDKISKIYSIEKKGDIFINEKKMSFNYKVKLPHKFVEIISDKNNIFFKEVFSSTKGYMIYGDKKEIFTVEKIKELRKKKLLFPLKYYAKMKEIKLICKEPINGIWCYKLKFQLEGDYLHYVYISEKTYMILKDETYKGDKMLFYIKNKDFKLIDGVKFPFKEIVFDSENKKKIELRVNQIKLNENFSNKNFK